jgi:23S rRNA pseudouridine2605 synthase
VKVNGHIAKLGDKAGFKDIITLDNQKIEQHKKSKAFDRFEYYKLYKPRGYASTLSDPYEEKTLTTLLENQNKIKTRVYPVGRLDKNSEGLILLTNDGTLANTIMHPKHHLEKRYRVTIRGKVKEETMAELSAGVDINIEVKNGRNSEIKRIKTAPCEINEISFEKAHTGVDEKTLKTTENKARTVLEFVLFEGKKRQIREMCATKKLELIRLKRVSIAGVKLGMLRPGEFEPLTKQELDSLLDKNI